MTNRVDRTDLRLARVEHEQVGVQIQRLPPEVAKEIKVLVIGNRGSRWVSPGFRCSGIVPSVRNGWSCGQALEKVGKAS